MGETTQMMIVGNVAGDPRIFGEREVPDRVTFRVMSNRRRFDAQEGKWIDDDPVGMNVVCWRNRARGVALSVRKGDPIIVSGRISQRSYVGNDGQQRFYTEIVADQIGLDLGRGYAYPFHRFSRPESTAADDAAEAAGEAGGTEDVDVIDHVTGAATQGEPDGETDGETDREDAFNGGKLLADVF